MATEMSSRPNKAAAEPSVEKADTAEEEDEPLTALQGPPKVSVLSKEQAVDLLKPGRGGRNSSKGAEDSLEGKFVDLVDLLPPVPVKGEFDVTKIKSSLYFFS